jgi:hypothetical protein
MPTRTLLLAVVALAAAVSAAPADPPQPDTSDVTDRSLWDKLIDATIQHVKASGPDSDVAQFLSMAREAAWKRRTEFVTLVTPYLTDKDPKNVAGAVEVLYRFRGYHPMKWIGDSEHTFEKVHAEFFAKVDESVHASLDHIHRLNDGKAFHQLALYMGVARSDEAKKELLRLARGTPAKAQALIALAWHRDPADMNDLLPFMLEDDRAAWGLPYHFRNSYGKAAIPHLKQAAKEAKAKNTREHAERELAILEKNP